MDLVRKILDLVAAFRAQDWPTAIRLTLEIITIITQGLMPQPMFGATPSPAKRASMMATDTMSTDSIVASIETHATAPGGPAIDILLPMLLTLLRRLLGF